MSGGTISNLDWGVKNVGTFNISNGTITNNSGHGIVNERSDTITGQIYMTGGNITGNTQYDIYHEKSDSDGAGAIFGGLRIERNETITSKIKIASYNNYIYVGNTTPVFTSIKLGDAHVERRIIRTENTENATTMINNITVINKGDYYYKANGPDNSKYIALWKKYTVTTNHKTDTGITLDSSSEIYEYKDNYTTVPGTFEGYVLSKAPSNSSGIVTGDITVDYEYESGTSANVAKVTYKDLLSDIVSAKYWYNSSSDNFSGNGTDFDNGTIFENYGYYKITVTNSVNLSKTIIFKLDKNSI